MTSNHASLSTPGAGSKPRRQWRVFFAVWTIAAAAAAWWLLTHEFSKTPIVIASGDASINPRPERIYEWLALAHLNLFRAYPWILLAPYALWLGARFHIEKCRWLWRLPLLLAAGVCFVLVSREVTRHLAVRLPQLMYLSGNIRVKQIVVGSGMIPFSPLLTNPGSSPITGSGTREWRVFIDEGPDDAPPGRHGESLLPGRQGGENFPRAVTNLIPAITTYVKSTRSASSGTAVPWATGLDVMAYVALIGMAHAGLFHRRYREREQQAVLLENRLNQARLGALQSQLQPHFLFNALNGIATLVRRDPAAAEEMITSLSDLLRIALGQSTRQTIPLRDELEFLDRYLEIQQMRFRDRLNVRRSIEPASLECSVPALLLQPLVENAIRHGIEPSPEAGVLCISSAREAGRLVLQVEDNGVGLGKDSDGTGVGLANVRERLQALYPGNHEFQLAGQPEGGVRVRISIPWSLEPEGALEQRKTA